MDIIWEKTGDPEGLKDQKWDELLKNGNTVILELVKSSCHVQRYNQMKETKIGIWRF